MASRLVLSSVAMGAKSGVLIGLGVAAAVGGLGAGGAHVLAARVIIPEPQVMNGMPEAPRVDGHEVTGDVRMFAPDGTERGVRDGDRLARPTGVVTSGFESAAIIGYREARFRASHDARVMFNAPGHRLAIYAEQGHVLVRLDQYAQDTIFPWAQLLAQLCRRAPTRQ